MTILLARIGIRPILWLLLTAGLLACALAWVGSVMFAHARIERLVVQEQAQALSDAKLTAANLNQRLAQARSIAMTLALNQNILTELAKFGPHTQASLLVQPGRGAVWLANPKLQAIATNLGQVTDRFALNTAWVTNAAGDTVAEAHAQGITPFTGTNYADRAYFKAAQQGMVGRQFAVGRATDIYGLFFSAPVHVNGQFVGMVGVSLAAPKLGDAIEPVNAWVTDDLGVIVLTKNPEQMMKAMPGAQVLTRPEQELNNRYKRGHFEVFQLSPAASHGPVPLVQWQESDRPHVMVSHPTDDGALRVHVVRDLGEPFSNSQRDQLWWFGLVSLLVLVTVTLLAVAAQYLITTQRQRHALLNLNAALTREANTDALTGCANRRHFMQTLAQERDRSTRYGFDLCVLSMDMDHFKRVNDTHGHAAGDEVLKHFVATVQTQLRAVDTLGRLGGEEFSILLPQTAAEGGALMAERIRASVEAAPAAFGPTRIPITVSIGGVQWPAASGQSVDQVLALADEAMYTAKHNGRNRVEWSQSKKVAANA